MSFRKNLIALSLFNAATLLKEQEEGAAIASPTPAPEVPSGEAPVDEKGKVITLEELIDRINVIRAGLSFEDPEVYGKLTTLFKGFTPEEKLKLYRQLTDISAIVQNIPAEKQSKEPETEAPAPAETPAEVPAPAAAPPAPVVPPPAAPAPAA